ncbi:hypothetical protein EVAR_33548_1 [Eumeta japonica]|uniref:Uncharacterized protein n=1 Tax=Eumeta variegata TaxID=151549 RepID=A0A4C1VI71_EUMVA|nr:hypothetical protein EVAR_33548_1 [Eumeta japonica]
MQHLYRNGACLVDIGLRVTEISCVDLWKIRYAAASAQVQRPAPAAAARPCLTWRARTRLTCAASALKCSLRWRWPGTVRRPAARPAAD